MDTERIVAAFGEWLGQRSFSANTAKSYTSQLKLFLQQENITFDSLQPGRYGEAIERYRLVLKEEYGLQPQSINLSMIALERFACYLNLPQAKFPRETVAAKRRDEPLVIGDLMKLHEATLRLKVHRDRCIVLLVLKLGFRAAEIRDLDIDDIHLDSETGSVNLRRGMTRVKEAAWALVLHDADVFDSLSLWIKERVARDSCDPAFFISKQGTRMTLDGVNCVLRHAGVEARIPTTGRMLVHMHKHLAAVIDEPAVSSDSTAG